jgi:hypothetical protein
MARATSTQQVILDVYRDSQFAKQSLLFRRLDQVKGYQFRPLLDLIAIMLQKPPTQGSRHAKATVICCASTNAYDATCCACGRRALEDFAQAKSIKVKRVKLPAGQHCQPNDIRGFNHRCVALWFKPPV